MYAYVSCVGGDGKALLDADRKAVSKNGETTIGFAELGDDRLATRSKDGSYEAVVLRGGLVADVYSYDDDIDIRTIEGFARKIDQLMGS